jgi:hypothetical protein
MVFPRENTRDDQSKKLMGLFCGGTAFPLLPACEKDLFENLAAINKIIINMINFVQIIIFILFRPEYYLLLLTDFFYPQRINCSRPISGGFCTPGASLSFTCGIV